MTASPQVIDKTVLVTGTSSGIGLASAIAAAQAGFRTVATVRDPDRADVLRSAAANAGVVLDIRRLDVTDPDSVTKCMTGVLETYGRLDALVNNAGAGHVGTIELETIEEVRATIELNFFGVVMMTRAAMPYLRASRGRLITVTSVGGVVGQPFNEAYCAAKFAVEGFMESLAPVAARVGVTVSVIEPGAVASAFVANVKADPPAMIAAAGPYAPAMRAYLARVTTHFSTAAQSSAQAAEFVMQALVAEHPAFRIQTSESARAFVGTKLADLDGEAVQRLTSSWVAGSAAEKPE